MRLLPVLVVAGLLGVSAAAPSTDVTLAKKPKPIVVNGKVSPAAMSDVDSILGAGAYAVGDLISYEPALIGYALGLSAEPYMDQINSICAATLSSTADMMSQMRTHVQITLGAVSASMPVNGTVHIPALAMGTVKSIMTRANSQVIGQLNINQKEIDVLLKPVKQGTRAAVATIVTSLKNAIGGVFAAIETNTDTYLQGVLLQAPAKS